MQITDLIKLDNEHQIAACRSLVAKLPEMFAESVAGVSQLEAKIMIASNLTEHKLPRVDMPFFANFKLLIEPHQITSIGVRTREKIIKCIEFAKESIEKTVDDILLSVGIYRKLRIDFRLYLREHSPHNLRKHSPERLLQIYYSFYDLYSRSISAIKDLYSLDPNMLPLMNIEDESHLSVSECMIVDVLNMPENKFANYKMPNND